MHLRPLTPQKAKSAIRKLKSLEIIVALDEPNVQRLHFTMFKQGASLTAPTTDPLACIEHMDAVRVHAGRISLALGRAALALDADELMEVDAMILTENAKSDGIVFRRPVSSAIIVAALLRLSHDQRMLTRELCCHYFCPTVYWNETGREVTLFWLPGLLFPGIDMFTEACS